MFKPNLRPMNGSDSNSFPLETRTLGFENKRAILKNIVLLFLRASREKITSNMTAFIGRKLGFNLFLGSLLLATPIVAVTSQAKKNEQHSRNEIKADTLKLWYDQKKPMIVLDARGEKYFDGTLLPNAIWLPSDSSEKEISKVIPSKNNLIVVYCSGVKCPASGWLYEKLLSMGYTNIYEYHEGIADWVSRGYPTTKSH